MLLRRAVGAAFITTGMLHFTKRRWYESIMPRYIPRHRDMVWISGVAEAVGGAALLVPAARPFARWWLLALLVAVFPANIHMAVNADDYGEFPEPLLWLRLPLQGVFGWVVWRATE